MKPTTEDLQNAIYSSVSGVRHAQVKVLAEHIMSMFTPNNKVYIFFYCSDIMESTFYPISLHRTIKGAYYAMRKHKLDAYERWSYDRTTFGKSFHNEMFGKYEYWCVNSKEIIE